jgi:hypothetical protein
MIACFAELAKAIGSLTLAKGRVDHRPRNVDDEAGMGENPTRDSLVTDYQSYGLAPISNDWTAVQPGHPRWESVIEETPQLGSDGWDYSPSGDPIHEEIDALNQCIGDWYLVPVIQGHWQGHWPDPSVYSQYTEARRSTKTPQGRKSSC